MKISYTRNAQGGYISHTATVTENGGSFLPYIYKCSGGLTYFWIISRESKSGNIRTLIKGSDYSLSQAKKSVKVFIESKMEGAKK